MGEIYRWWVSWIEHRRLMAVGRKIERLLVMIERLSRKLNKKEKKLRAVERRLSLISESVVGDIEEAKQELRVAEEAIESLQSEKRILADVMIPTLIATHQLILKRLDAEIAIAARNQALASPIDREVDVG